MKLPSTNTLVDSERKKLLFFNGKTGSFPVCCKQFLAYIEEKNLKENSES